MREMLVISCDFIFIGPYPISICGEKTNYMEKNK
jgi:hypothetical protein